MKSPAAKLAVSVAFLERLRADRLAGVAESAETYRAAYPGFEDVIDAELAAEFAHQKAPDTLATVETPTTHAGTTAGDIASNGRNVGPYKIERILGRGGQGAVYLATDERLGRRVALKTLPPSWCLDPMAIRRFAQEVRVLAALDHPGLCPVYEAATADGVPYIAMRYVEGETLASRIARLGRAPNSKETEACVRIVERVASAVHAAHEAGFLHRDLKPANVMVQADDRPVVLDFGLSRSLAGSSELTMTGDVVGTPAYMAPEQASGDVLHIDRRTDIYALGVMLYEATTGKRPFSAPTTAGLLALVLGGAPPPPRTANGAIDADLEVVVRTAMAREARDRYATAQDLAEDLRLVLADQPIRARPIPWTGRVLRAARRRPLMTALIVAVVLLIPVAGGFAGWFVANRPLVEAQERAIRIDRAERALLSGYRAALFEREVDDPLAAGAFAEALKLTPDSEEAIAGFVRNEIRARRRQPAWDKLDDFERQNGVGAITRRVRAEWLTAFDRPAEAAVLLKDLPPPMTASECFVEGMRFYVAARGLRARRDEDRIAAEWFAKATQRTKVFRRLYLEGLALAIGRTKDEAEARRTAETVRLMIPGREGAYFAGYALLSADPDAAIEALRLGAKTDAETGVPLTNAVPAHLANLGRFKEAAEMQRIVLKHHPDDATAWFNLSLMESRAGDAESGVDAARRAVALRPDIADMHVQLALLLLRNGGPLEEVVSGLERALAIEPSNAMIRAHFAHALFKAGRSEDGDREAERVFTSGLQDPPILIELARAILPRNPLLARTVFLRLSDARPEEPDLVLMAAVASAAAGDGAEALALAERAASLAKRKPLHANLEGQIEKIRSAFGTAADSESRPAEHNDPLDVP